MTNYQGGPESKPTPLLVQASPREQYRRSRTRRQTIIYGGAIFGLVAALVVGLLGLAGSLLTSFDSDFHRKESYAEAGDTPCPTPDARPQSPKDVRLLVYNTTATPGVAASVAEYFEELGYAIGATDNASLYRGTVLIETGPRGVDDAYTLARFLGADVRIRLASFEDKTLAVFLGERFEGMPNEEETAKILDRSFALVPLAGCLPVEEPAGGWAVPQELLDAQSGQSGEQSADQLEDDAEGDEG